MIRTFLDSGVLIAATRGKPADMRAAGSLLADPGRVFLSSPFLELEILPHAQRCGTPAQLRLLKTYLETAESIPVCAPILESARSILLSHPLQLADALHLAAARLLRADAFITTERPSRPIFSTTYLPVLALRS